MATVTFVAAAGTRTTVDVPLGVTVMEAAVENRIYGIVGECGGQMSCATCHVFVEAEPSDPLCEPGEIEDETLDITACERRENSRLGCQLVMTPELDGLVVHLPEHQL